MGLSFPPLKATFWWDKSPELSFDCGRHWSNVQKPPTVQISTTLGFPDSGVIFWKHVGSKIVLHQADCGQKACLSPAKHSSLVLGTQRDSCYLIPWRKNWKREREGREQAVFPCVLNEPYHSRHWILGRRAVPLRESPTGKTWTMESRINEYVFLFPLVIDSILFSAK